MAVGNLLFQQRTESTIQNLQTQIGQLATSMAQPQNNNSLPSQTIPNPKGGGSGNVSAITLRSGKQLEEPNQVAVEPSKKDDTGSKEQARDISDIHIPLPFPQRHTQSKKQAEKAGNQEILDIFRKIEVNIPLLDAIQQIPKYAKFLKELCTNKRRLKGNERVSLSQNVSALIQPMPQKCQDPGTFSIPCTIGHSVFHDCMLDLGASINVMPESVYKSLGLGPLHTTGIVIQLANRSSVRPSGLVEDVLVRVGNLIFPADFYIMGMEGETPSDTIILGRPFMKTARTKIDVHSGTLSMEFGDSTVRFNIIDAMKQSRKERSVFCINITDEVIEDVSTDIVTEYPEFSSFLDPDVCECDCAGGKECTICAEIALCCSGKALASDLGSIDNFDLNDDSDVKNKSELLLPVDLPVDIDCDQNAISENFITGIDASVFSAELTLPTTFIPFAKLLRRKPPKLRDKNMGKTFSASGHHLKSEILLRDVIYLPIGPQQKPIETEILLTDVIYPP